MISPPYHTRPTTPTSFTITEPPSSTISNTTTTNTNTAYQFDLNSMMPFMFIHPPMPPPMSEDACCPPQPDASLLFGTPAPTRVPTAAPTVNSSPSKFNNSIGIQTNTFDHRTTSVITQAMAALQFSSTYNSSTSSDFTINLCQQQSNFDNNIIVDCSNSDNHNNKSPTTTTSWAPGVIRLKAPTVPISDAISIIPTSVSSFSSDSTTTITTSLSDINSTVPIITTSEPPRTSSPCR